MNYLMKEFCDCLRSDPEMFRYTTTFLVIFMVLNHDFAASRSIDFPVGQRNELTREKEEVEETGLAEVPNSREKRTAGKFIQATLNLAASGTFLLSAATTVYHAIQKCKDYRPSTCKTATCNYLSTCPVNVCENPETNRILVEGMRRDLKVKLDDMDAIQRTAFNLATQAINAGTNNRIILSEIDRINQKVDELIFSIAQLDIELGTKLRNNSFAIGTLIRNEKLSLDEILSSPEINGIFDEWTWEGTGVFILSLALPITLKTYSYFKQRHAINKIYEKLKTDFSVRFVDQNTRSLNANAKIGNKFTFINDISTQTLDQDLKETAKSIYDGQQANQEVSRFEEIMNNFITPIINVIVTALSIWATYAQIDQCQTITNDMQNTAIDMVQQADKIEYLKLTQVDPLLENVTTQAWPQVREMMTNQTTLDWLDEIRNLTLGASGANVTNAAVIQDFIDNIGTASYDQFIDLQEELIIALKDIDYEFTCLADKQHAITTVLTDCKIGRLSFPDLYQYATTTHKLNRDGCIAKGIMPYTTQEQFWVILNATAYHEGFYNNCLLNDDGLRDDVCDADIQGYATPEAIVAYLNTTGLTEEMVPNFLGRCEPPDITPKKREDTCDLYCWYKPLDEIVQKVILLQDQVLEVIEACPICSVDEDDLAKICKLYYCDLNNASTVETEVEIPLATVNYIIANNCSNKCIIDDTDTKKSICDDYSCKGKSVATIATGLGVPESAVNDVLPECNTIVSTCVVDMDERKQIMSAHCYWGATATSMVAIGVISRSVQVVQDIIDSQTCADFLANGVPGSWTFTP